MLHVTAKLSAEVIADEEVDDAVLGLGLEGHLPVRLLQHRPEQRRENQRFGKQPFDDRRIIVIGQY